jgi:hypothetical protein
VEGTSLAFQVSDDVWRIRRLGELSRVSIACYCDVSPATIGRLERGEYVGDVMVARVGAALAVLDFEARPEAWQS